MLQWFIYKNTFLHETFDILSNHNYNYYNINYYHYCANDNIYHYADDNIYYYANDNNYTCWIVQR